MAWVGLGVLLAVRLALAQPWAADSWTALAVVQVAYLVPFALGTGGSMILARRTAGVERRFWGLLCVALGLSLASEVYVSAYILWVDPAGPVPPAAFELLHVAAILVFFAAMVTATPIGATSPWTRVRFYLDVLASVIVLVAVTYLAVILPVFGKLTGVPETAFAVAAAYLVVAAVFVVSTVSMFLIGPRRTWRAWEWFIAVSFAVLSAGLVAWPFWLLSRASGEPPQQSMSFVELGLSTGTYLFFMACVYRATAPDTPWPRRPLRVRAVAHPWLSVALHAFLVACVPALGAVAFSLGHSTESDFVLATSLVLAGVLALLNWSVALEIAFHERRAGVDALTGLPNERAFRQRVADALHPSAWLDGQLTVLILDIDDFSRMNDVGGHAAGDQLLVRASEMLQGGTAGVSEVYRIGGDEFGFVLPAMTPEAAADVARRLESTLDRQAAESGVSWTFSGGIASAHGRETDAKALIEHAFTALQSAKLRQRGTVLAYDPGDEEPLTPEERLDRARKQWHLSTVRALAAAVDARDPASRLHSREVARLSRQLAERLGLSGDRVAAIELAASVHDVGKLALPDELIASRPVVSEDQRALLREHVELSERILRSTDLAYLLPWIRSHHERWDGLGYPEGLVGEEIPFEARILAVCDAYHTMTSGLYQGVPMSAPAALQEIDRNLGTQFEPAIGGAFIEMVSPEVSRSES